MQSNNIPIYKKNDFQKMQKAGRLAAYILDQLFELIQPGISTLDLDRIAEEYIISNNAIPGFKGLYGYPSTICISIEVRVEYSSVRVRICVNQFRKL